MDEFFMIFLLMSRSLSMLSRAATTRIEGLMFYWHIKIRGNSSEVPQQPNKERASNFVYKLCPGL